MSLAEAGLRLLEREEQVATHLDPQRRFHAAVERLERARGRSRSSFSSTGYWSRMQRDPPVRRDDGIADVPARAGNEAAVDRRSRSAARARVSRASPARRAGVTTSCAVSPA